ELSELAMYRVAKRSGVRWCRRKKLHRDVEDVSRARDRLAARHLHLIVVLAAEEVHSKARNCPDRKCATAFNETPRGTTVQHPNRQLAGESAELVVFAWKLIRPPNHSLPDSAAPCSAAPKAA